MKRTLKKIFYVIKPLVPRSLQLYLRRKLVFAKLHKYKDVWPVLSGSEKQPENFAGWPDSHQFALILTHDVEHKKGYDRVLQLIDVEEKLGFVSSFNFVPQRDYVVEKSLLKKIIEKGFEVGVHGLNHDGKLFKSKKIFDERAIKINNYIKEWGCKGFRAPSMHHNLEWLKGLDIEYDLSTFDTDPFEPQSDGVGTIFPFWVNGNGNKNGYVELPYTLVQDFTLFILMKEQSDRIWREKLDWVAENGGMALLNVHPDYTSFNGKVGREEFPVGLYSNFLKYIKEKYNGKYWNALPYEAAQYFRETHKNLERN